MSTIAEDKVSNLMWDLQDLSQKMYQFTTKANDVREYVGELQSREYKDQFSERIRELENAMGRLQELVEGILPQG